MLRQHVAIENVDKQQHVSNSAALSAYSKDVVKVYTYACERVITFVYGCVQFRCSCTVSSYEGMTCSTLCKKDIYECVSVTVKKTFICM